MGAVAPDCIRQAQGCRMRSPGKPKKERKPSLRHIRLHYWMMDTAAWQSLDSNARAIYIEIAARYCGTNNGRIVFGCRDAEKILHIGRHGTLDALADLQHRGFIVATRKGSFSQKTRHSTEWRLTEFRCDVTGTEASRDFVSWQPVVVPWPARSKRQAKTDG
jgi:hypothetical protein